MSPRAYDNLHKYKLHHDRQNEYLKQLSGADKRSNTTQKNLPMLSTIAAVTSNGGFYNAHHHAAAPLAASKPIHEEVSEDQQSLHEGEVLATLKQSKYKNRPNSSKMSKRHQTAPNGMASSALVQGSRNIGLEIDPSKECSGIEVKFNRRKAEVAEPSIAEGAPGGKSVHIPGSKLDADFLNLFSK